MEQGETIEDMMMKVADEHKCLKERLHKRIIELEANLDKQRALVMKIIDIQGGTVEDIMMKLADEHKVSSIILEKKRAVELVIVSLKGAVKVMKHVIGDGDGEANKRLESMEQFLKDKEEQLEEIK